MRLGFILILLFIGGCASSQPRRDIASEAYVHYDHVDLSQSLVQLFPSVSSEENPWGYFYLMFKDASGNYVDVDPDEISVKTRNGRQIAFEYERKNVGRYYLTLQKGGAISSRELNFFIQGKRLTKQFKLHLKLPDQKHTRIQVLENNNYKITFRLDLRDKFNRPVETPDTPEVLVDGPVMIEDLKRVREGVWEFSVIYPDENQIMYFSVRAMGVLFSNLHRYQHVEKHQ